MLAILSICVVLISSAASQNCAGNTPPNGVVTKGVYWYTCVNGRLEPSGCIDNTGRRIQINEAYRENDKEVTCRKGTDGFLMFEQSACYKDNYRVAADGIYEDLTTWYICERVGTLYLYFKPAGCMNNGRKVYFSERVQQNSMIHECYRDSHGSSLRVVGCLIDNQEYMVGDRFQDDKFLYTCEVDGDNSAKKKVIGCVYNGQTYYDYQIYRKQDEIFRCEVKPGRVAADHKICGCVARLANRPPVDKLIGCQWVDDMPDGHESYLMQCRLDEQGNAVTERIRCLYQSTLGYHMEVVPNCFRPIYGSQNNVGCHRDPATLQLQVKIFRQDDWQTAYDYNLRFC